MNLPLNDWQFWATSVICIGAAYFVLRPLLPTRGKRGPCCNEGAAAEARKRRVKLTVSASEPRDSN